MKEGDGEKTKGDGERRKGGQKMERRGEMANAISIIKQCMHQRRGKGDGQEKG